MRRLLCLASCLLIACGCERAEDRQAPADRPDGLPASGARVTVTIAHPDTSGDWTQPAKDYSNSRFSTLDQITAGTVKRLGVKLTFSTGVNAGHEAAPLIANGTMYLVTPWPNI